MSVSVSASEQALCRQAQGEHCAPGIVTREPELAAMPLEHVPRKRKLEAEPRRRRRTEPRRRVRNVEQQREGLTGNPNLVAVHGDLCPSVDAAQLDVDGA